MLTTRQFTRQGIVRSRTWGEFPGFLVNFITFKRTADRFLSGFLISPERMIRWKISRWRRQKVAIRIRMT